MVVKACILDLIGLVGRSLRFKYGKFKFEDCSDG